MTKAWAKCADCSAKSHQWLRPRQITNPVKYVLVSDYPGMAELFASCTMGKQAVQILEKCLVHAGIKPSDCAVVNACVCSTAIGQDTLPPDAVSNCRDRLVEEIKSLSPQLVILMGDVAVTSITGSTQGIQSLRGKHFWSEEFSCPVMYTFNPKQILNMPKAFNDMLTDMVRIKSEIDKGLQQLQETVEVQYFVANTPEQAVKLFSYLNKFPKVACDIETGGFNFQKDRLLCVGYCWEPGKAAVVPGELFSNPDVWRAAKEFHEGPTKFIWQNGKFDIKFFKKQYGIKARVDKDTMLGNYCLDERKGIHDLETMSSVYLGEGDYKTSFKRKSAKGKDGVDFSKAPVKSLYAYNAKDCSNTFRVDDYLYPQVVADGNSICTYERLLIPASEAYSNMEINGILVDPVYLDQLIVEYASVIEKLANQLIDTAIDVGWDPYEYQRMTGSKSLPKQFNAGSWQQLGHVMFDLLKLPLFKRKRSTDKKALAHICKKKLMQPGHKYYEALYPDDADAAETAYQSAIEEWLEKHIANRFIYTLMEYRRITKLYSTYMIGVRDAMFDDGRVHPTFLLNGTMTGRRASRGPNAQNLPRGNTIKHMFVAPEGKVLLQCDYSQCIAEDTWVDDCRIQDHPDSIYKGKAETFIVTTKRGYHVEPTSDHQILTSTGWKETNQLQIGDWVALKGKNVVDSEFDPYWWVIGFWVGDGSFHNSAGTLQFSKKLDEDVNTISLLIAKGINEIPRDYGGYSLNVTNQKKLVSWLRKNFNKNDLRLPFDQLDNLSSVLSGLFDADASVDINGIEFTSRFESLVNDVQQCLLRFGVMSTKIKTLTGYNYVKDGAMQYKLHICDSVSLNNFNKLIGFQLSRKAETLKLVLSKSRRDQSNFVPIPVEEIRGKGADYRKYVLNYLHGRPYTRSKLKELKGYDLSKYTEYHWDQVQEVVPSGRKVNVYDLMDQPRNMFTANGVIVHNCELRVLAVLSQDPFLRDTYMNGRDLHDDVARELFGDYFTKEQRVRAKAVNFGLAYGRTPESIAEEYDFDRKEAKHIVDEWFRKIPVAGQYIKDMRNMPHLGIVVETVFGRKRRFGLVTQDNAWNTENESINFPIQSTAADCTLLSVIAIDQWLQAEQIEGAFIINEVHDSILMEVYEKDAYRIAAKMKEIMEYIPPHELSTDIPFLVDLEVGKRWSEVKKVKLHELGTMYN